MTDTPHDPNEVALATIAPAPLAQGGAASRLLTLDRMNDHEFEARIETLRRSQSRMRRIQRELLVVDEDYGEIPGTSRGKPGEKGYKAGKPTLLKAGAEKLCKFYGLAPTFDVVRTIGDGLTAPAVHVAVTCSLHLGDALGPVIASADGTANTWESKYRWRTGARTCPSCGVVGLRRSKFPPRDRSLGSEPGWWCTPPEKGGAGCGAEFAKDDPEVTGQVSGKVENPDPLDLDNTVVKMATKRAFIAATLIATATSGLFTQDLDDMVDPKATTARTAEVAERAPRKPEADAPPAAAR
jgi:hypothetical protein